MKNRSSIQGKTSRRSFTRSVAATLVAAPLAVTLAHAQTPDKKEAPAPPKPQPSPSPAPQKPSPLALAYAEAARIRFGEHITPEQFEKMKEDFENSVRSADRLRKAKLQNGDEPDFIFNA